MKTDKYITLEKQLMNYVEDLDIERLQLEQLIDDQGIPYIRIGGYESWDFNDLMICNADSVARNTPSFQQHLYYVRKQLKQSCGRAYKHYPEPKGIANKVTNTIKYRFLGQKNKFKQLVQGKTYAHFIYRYNSEVIFKYCFKYNGYTKRCAVMYRLHHYYRCQAIVEQALKDNLPHIVPFIIAFASEPAELKRRLGKSTWKRLCANTLTRNQVILGAAEAAAANIVEDELQTSEDEYFIVIPSNLNAYSTILPKVIEAMYRIVPKLLQYKSGLLQNNYFCWWTPEKENCFNWINRVGKVTKPDSVKELINLYVDTQNYTSVNPKWSIRRMREEHDKGVKRENEKRLRALEAEYSKPKYHQPLFSTTITGEVDGVKVRLLNTEMDYIKESLEMQHCLYDAYWYEAEERHIVAFGLQWGEERTTIAFTFYRGKSTLNKSPMQHYGYRNANVQNTKLQRLHRSKAFRAILDNLSNEHFYLKTGHTPSVFTTIQLIA